MPNFTFICEHPAEEEFAPRVNTVSFTAETWGEVLTEVDTFLKGCGYHYDGEVDVVQAEPVYQEPKWNPQPLEEAFARMRANAAEKQDCGCGCPGCN